MFQVRPRTRKLSAKRAREVQGMLAMQGLVEEGTEKEFATDREAVSIRRNPLTKPERAAELRPLPYRLVVAEWPTEWRERWGRRANDLEALGLSWRDAEGRAFVEVWSQLRDASDVARN